MKSLYQVTVTVNPDQNEIVSAWLWNLEPGGIEEDNNKLNVFFEDELDPLPRVELLLAELNRDGVIGSYTVMSSPVEHKNWNEEWEQNVRVIRVSEKVIIKPTFRDYSVQPGELVLTIDPKMSFGTGEHETTRLVIRLLEKHIRGGESVLDVGTGTGVLAIAAVKLGAARALAIDNDEWCLENGLENALLNGVQDIVDIRTAVVEATPAVAYGLVLANIQKNVLLPLVSELCSRVAPGGLLILSGLLHQDREDILAAYSAAGMALLDESSEGEWISLCFLK